MARASNDVAEAKAVAISVFTPDLESDFASGKEQFVVGQWEVEISDWRRDCIPNAWMACFCPCVSVAQISARITPGSFRLTLLLHFVLNALVLGLLVATVVFLVEFLKAPPLTSSVASALTPWICFTVLLLFSAVSTQQIAKLRTRVRERFQIPGTEIQDGKQVYWCSACAIAQMATQVKSYKPGSCDFYEPDALPAYIR